MSWAEIKKVNSDLSLPLNDLILDTSDNCVRGLKTITGSSADYTSNPQFTGLKTIANVTGKGRIANCLFYYPLNHNANAVPPVTSYVIFKLIVDDKPIFHVKHAITNASSHNHIGIVNIKGQYFDYDTSNDGSHSTKPINDLKLNAQGDKIRRTFIDLSPDLQEITDEFTQIIDIQHYVLMDKCIRFNKNFKFTVETESDRYINRYDYLITYKLED